jgi:hypothetical protein
MGLVIYNTDMIFRLKEKKHGLYHRLWLYLMIAIIPLVLAVGLITYSTIVVKQYKEFMNEVYFSFDIGIENNSIRADYNEQSTRLTEKNADSINSLIQSGRPTKYKEELNDNANILLDFGNGNQLLIYQYNNETVIFRLIKSEGYDKAYISTDVVRLIDFERLISLDFGNNLWIK